MGDTSLSNYAQEIAKYLGTIDKILDSTYVLELISQVLTGLAYDENNKEVRIGPKIVTEEGHGKIMTILRININPPTKLGILTIEKLENMVASICEEIAILIGIYGAELGVDQTMLDSIGKSFYNLIYTHMSSSLGGELVKNLTTNIQIISQNIEEGEGKRK